MMKNTETRKKIPRTGPRRLTPRQFGALTTEKRGVRFWDAPYKWIASAVGYSYRSDTIGSSAAARRAGQTPKRMPTSAENPNASTIEDGDTAVFQLRR